MRTFPRELAEFRTIVEERGDTLRKVPFKDLQERVKQPTESLLVQTRPATIDLIVLPAPKDGIQIVLQGFLKHRFMPGKSVALDGFYKFPDESVQEMEAEEFYQFD